MPLGCPGVSSSGVSWLSSPLNMPLTALLCPAVPVARCPVWPEGSSVLCPYDADGNRTDSGVLMRWDLRPGQRIRLAPGHNVQGAMQPTQMHIGAAEPVVVRGVRRQPAPGNGVVLRRDEPSSSFKLNIEGCPFSLGLWWLDAAARGAVAQLPVVNIKPEFAAADTGRAALAVCPA